MELPEIEKGTGHFLIEKLNITSWGRPEKSSLSPFFLFFTASESNSLCLP